MPAPPINSVSINAVSISVVIACRDAAATLPAQLEALTAQVMPESLRDRWQLLLCDNGSTDATVAVAQTYLDRLPLTIVDAARRPGAGAARNVGAALALGRDLAFCDADDVVAADWLSTMTAALAEHSFVAGRLEAARLNSAGALRSRALSQGDGLQGRPGGLPHAGAGNLGIRRSLFEQVGGFDPTLRSLEDTDLSWRVQLTGVPLTFAPEVVVHVRLRASFSARYRQGRDYGRAYAQLQQLHPAEFFGSAAPTRLRLAHLVWQLGWWWGHRAGRSARRKHGAQPRGEGSAPPNG